jgi:peptidoglycan/LPS O-acetylase OafA/YrhL
MLNSDWPNVSYRADIQGLRALAVILVIIFHADIPFFQGGYIGVDVFFVISGYLISGLLFKELNTHHQINFKRFYARRIRRILPLSVFVAFVTLVLFSFYLSPLELNELSKTTLFTSLFSSNMWFVFQSTDYFGTDIKANALLHTWSLGVEEQFYFLWPAVIALLPILSSNRNLWKWNILLVSVTSLLAFLYIFKENQPLAFFGMPTRAWQFGFGALIYFIPINKKVSGLLLNCAALIGLAAILVTTFSVSAGFNGNPFWALLPTLGACLIIWSGHNGNKSIVYRILSIPPMVFIGSLSYSLYLWHWPVFVLLKLEGDALEFYNIVLGLIIIFCLSYLSFRFLETPIRLNQKLSSHYLSFIFGGVLVAVGVGSSLFYYRYASSALNSSGQQKIAAAKFAGVGVRDCKTLIPDVAVVDCILGDVNSDITIVLLGDSKIQQWLPVVSDMGIKNGWKIIPVIKDGCSPALINVYLGNLGREYNECNLWRDFAIKRVVELNPDILMISHFTGYSISENGASTTATEKDWLDGYIKLSEKISAIDSKLLFLRDNPGLPINAPKCLSRSVGSGELSESMCQIVISDMSFKPSFYRAAISGLSRYSDTSFLDLSSNYCSEGFCPVYSRGVVRYIDSHHLSLEFTKEISQVIEIRLSQLVAKSKIAHTIWK